MLLSDVSTKNFVEIQADLDFGSLDNGSAISAIGEKMHLAFSDLPFRSSSLFVFEHFLRLCQFIPGEP